MELKFQTDMTQDTLKRQDYNPDNNAHAKRHLRSKQNYTERRFQDHQSYLYATYFSKNSPVVDFNLEKLNKKLKCGTVT